MKLGYFLFFIGTCFTFFSCEALNSVIAATKDDSITTELFKDVEITISGTVTSVDTEEPLEGMTVSVQEYSGESLNSTLGTATTDSSGEYAITETMVLKVDEYEYRLEVSDGDDVDEYYTNDSTLLYVLRDSTLTGYDVIMVPKNPTSNTTVQGTVKNGISRSSAIPGVTVTLTNIYDSTEVYSTTTLEDDESTTDVNEEGTYSLEVPVSSYRIVYDGSSLATQYISEYTDETLKNTAVNNLGTHFIVPEVSDGELRVVLQWYNSNTVNYDLQTNLDLFREDFVVVNTAGPQGNKVAINSRYSLNPGTGFADGSSYWPISVEPSPERELFHFTDPIDTPTERQVGGETVIQIDRDESQDTPIEIITFYQQNPLTYNPANLLYYYLYSNEPHYPIGVYNLVVYMNNRDAGVNIYDSKAQVKIYQGNQFQGSFDIGSFTPAVGESNVISWDVLFIEVGFTKPDPTSTSDLYFRAVPFFSISPESGLWQEPPFVTQTMYHDGSSLQGTHDNGSVTALFYDENWGLIMGTDQGNVGTLWRNKDELFSDFPFWVNTDPVVDLAIYDGEMIALTESGGIGSIYSVFSGNLMPEVVGTRPADSNIIYSNSRSFDKMLIAGAADGLHEFTWAADGTWTKGPIVNSAGTPTGGTLDDAVTFISPGTGFFQVEPVGAVIAGGQVYVYNVAGYYPVAGLDPPVGATGSVVMGGFYGYVDSLFPNEIFWGITDANEVYLNWYNPVAKTTGTSTMLTSLSYDITHIDLLANPSEPGGGQPVITTNHGVYLARYNESAGSGLPAASYFSLELHPFFPSDLSVNSAISTDTTTFFGTELNGVIHTLGGQF